MPGRGRRQRRDEGEPHGSAPREDHRAGPSGRLVDAHVGEAGSLERRGWRPSPRSSRPRRGRRTAARAARPGRRRRDRRLAGVQHRAPSDASACRSSTATESAASGSCRSGPLPASSSRSARRSRRRPSDSRRRSNASSTQLGACRGERAGHAVARVDERLHALRVADERGRELGDARRSSPARATCAFSTRTSAAFNEAWRSSAGASASHAAARSAPPRPPAAGRRGAADQDEFACSTIGRRLRSRPAEGEPPARRRRGRRAPRRRPRPPRPGAPAAPRPPGARAPGSARSGACRPGGQVGEHDLVEREVLVAGGLLGRGRSGPSSPRGSSPCAAPPSGG